MSIGARYRIQLALLHADLKRLVAAPPITHHPSRNWRQRLVPFLLIAFILFALGLVGRIDRNVEQAQVDDEQPTRLSFDLDDCTPPGVPVNNQIDLAIHHHGDRLVFAGCTRYAASNTIPTSDIIAQSKGDPQP